MQKLSIIIPAYNEEAFIGKLLALIQKVPVEMHGFSKEIIVVDDGSKDRTSEIARSFDGVKVLRQEPNQGKGKAVQRGVLECTGDYVLVQDGDLEYDPQDYIPMLESLKGKPLSTAVYGSRVWGEIKSSGWIRLFPGKGKKQGIGPWLAGVVLSIWTWLLYGKFISDTLTAYKLYPAGILKSLVIKTEGFETDHEITSKLVKQGVQIIEVPISYCPRSRDEGKKIGMSDGFVAIWTLLRFRFRD